MRDWKAEGLHIDPYSLDSKQFSDEFNGYIVEDILTLERYKVIGYIEYIVHATVGIFYKTVLCTHKKTANPFNFNDTDVGKNCKIKTFYPSSWILENPRFIDNRSILCADSVYLWPQNISTQVTDHILNSRFPHKCILCKSPSYNGFNKIECSNLKCSNYKN